MVDNQEFNWEEVPSEVTSDIEKKNPIGNEQVTQLESQDGQPISSESGLEVQSTLPTDDKDKGVKYYTKTDKSGKTTYWKKDKWGEKAITKTTYDFENKNQVEKTPMVTDAEFTEIVPLDNKTKEEDIVNVNAVGEEPKKPKTQEDKFKFALGQTDAELENINNQINQIESLFNEVVASGGNPDEYIQENEARNQLLQQRDIFLDRKNKLEAGIRNVSSLEIIDDGIIGGTANRLKYFYDKALSGVSGLSLGAADIMLNLMANIPGMVPEGMSKDEALKIAKEDIKPAIKEGLVKTIGTDLDEQRREQYDSEFVTSAIGGLAESAPAMFSPYGTGLILQSYNGAIESINESEEGKNLPESTKTAFGLSVGIAQGLLEKYGLDKVLGLGGDAAEKVAVSAIKDLIKGGDNKITAEAFEKAAEKIVTNVTKGAKIEGLTGGTQEVATIGLEKATNVLTGKQIFDHGSWGKLGSRVIQSAGGEAVGGGLLGGIKTVYDVASSNPKKELVNKIKQADGKVEGVKDLLDSVDALDEATPEQKQQMKSKITGMVERSKRIPEGVTNPDARVQSDELLENIDKLRKQKEVIDEVYKKDIQNLIDEIGNDLLEIARTNKPVDKKYSVSVEEQAPPVTEQAAATEGEVQVQEALKDVESTAKALEKINIESNSKLANIIYESIGAEKNIEFSKQDVTEINTFKKDESTEIIDINSVLDKETDEATRKLIEVLKPYLRKNSKIYYQDGYVFKGSSELASGFRYAATIDGKGNILVFDRNSLNSDIVLHEIMHDFLLDSINVNKDEVLIKELTRIFNKAKNNADLTERYSYAFSNLDEFVSEIFGDKGFRQELSYIKDFNLNKTSNIFQSVSNAIKDFLERKFNFKISNTLLDSVFNAIETPVKNKNKLSSKSISESYHKAKADGSNPELVKAVEELLGKPKEVTPSSPEISLDEEKRNSIIARLENAKAGPTEVETLLASGGNWKSIIEKGGNDIYNKVIDYLISEIKQQTTLGKAVQKTIEYIDGFMGNMDYDKQAIEDELTKLAQEEKQKTVVKESKKISPSLKRAQDWAFAEGRTVGAIEQAKLDSKEAKKVNKEFDKERKAASKESQKLVDMAYDFGFAEGSEAGKFEQASKDYKEFEKEKKKLSKQEQERIDRVYKLGKTDGRRPGLEMIEIAKMLKDYINSDKEFKANINKSKNAKTILLNKVTKLIESTESKQSVKNKRLNDLLDYMDKLSEDGKYQDKLEEAQSIRKSIKSAIPKSDKTIPFDLKEMYRKLYSINPSKISPLELDRYNNLMDDFTKKVMPKVNAGEYNIDVPSMNNINNAINVLYNGLNSRQTSAAYNPFNKVKSLGEKYLSEVQFNDLMNQLNNGNITEEEFAKAVENKFNEFIERLNLDVASKASELSDFIASEEAAGNMDDYSKAEKEVLKTYTGVDPTKLSEADKLKYLFYAERIMTERNFIGSGIMANKIIGSKKKSAVTNMVDGIKNGLNVFERLVASRFATKEMFWKFATKTANDAVKLREATGMSEVFNSSSEAKKSHEKFIAKYENIIDKWKKKGVDLREPVSIYKRGIYSKLIQYKENTTEGKDYAYEQGVKIIKSNIDSLLGSPSKRQRDKGALLKKAFEESGVEGKTRDEFIRNFEIENPAEVELVNEAKKFFDKYKERFRDVTEIYNNKTFDDWYEYTPTATEKIYAGDEVKPEEAKAKEFLSGYSKQAPLPGSIKERIPTASTKIAYDYNFDNVMSDKALDMLMYVYAQKDYQIASAVINSKEVIDALGGAETHGILSMNLRDKVEADFGLDYESSDEATKYTRDLMKLGYNTVATTLGSVTQLPKQYIPAITDYFVTQGDFTLFAPSLNEAINLIAANGLREKGVQLADKDVALLKLMDKFPIGERLRRNPNFDFQMSDNELSKISFSSTDKKINWLKDKHRKMISGVMASLRKSDNFAATQTWVAEYLKQRKKKGVDISKIDWQKELENPDMDAANAAEIAVSTTQNVSDVSLGSRQMTKKQYNLSKQIFFNLASFALNAKARLYVDVRNLVTGSDPKVALKSLIGYSSQVAAYLVMSSIVKDGIEKLSDLLFNPEDEEDKRRREKEEMEKSQEEKDLEKQRQEERDKKRLLTSIVNEGIFSGIPQDLVNLVYAGFNQLNAYRLSDDIEKLMTEIDSINEDIKKYPDDSNLKINLNLKQKELEALVRSKDVINIFDQEGRNYGPISMYLGIGTKLFEKIEKANTIDDLTPREQKVLWSLIIGDALSLGMIDEGTWKSVRNKSWTKLKKQLEDKYGGKTITITTKPKKQQE